MDDTVVVVNVVVGVMVAVDVFVGLGSAVFVVSFNLESVDGQNLIPAPK